MGQVLESPASRHPKKMTAMPPILTSAAIPRDGLSVTDIRSMFRVFRENFEGATLDIFERDLSNKNWVILLYDGETGELEGFSSLALYETQINHQKISVVYSGDTIIRREYWGTPELPRSWIHTVLEKSANMTQPLYWLLISSGYKTYRFLTVFYKEFYPRYDKPTPPEMQAIMEQLARQRFALDYHCEEGIVRFKQGATPDRKSVV